MANAFFFTILIASSAIACNGNTSPVCEKDASMDQQSGIQNAMTQSDWDRLNSYPRGETVLLNRTDPIIWGDDQDDVEMKLFAEKGFLMLPQVFTHDEVDQLRDDAAALDAAIYAGEVSPGKGVNDVWVLPEPSSLKNRSRAIWNIHKAVPEFLRLPCVPRVASVVQKVIGEPTYVHQARLHFKEALIGRPVFWHSDFETAHNEDHVPLPRCIVMGLMMTDAEANDPCGLSVIPGSHKYHIPTYGTGGPPLGISKSSDDKVLAAADRRVVPNGPLLADLMEHLGVHDTTPLSRGDLIIFDCNMLHASGANLGFHDRIAFFLELNAVSNKNLMQSKRPPAIAQTEHTPVCQEGMHGAPMESPTLGKGIQVDI